MRLAYWLFPIIGFSSLPRSWGLCSAQDFRDTAPEEKTSSGTPSLFLQGFEELDWKTLSPDVVRTALALLQQNPSSVGRLTAEQRDQYTLRSLLENDPGGAKILTRTKLAKAQPADLPLVVPLTSTASYLRPGRLTPAGAAIMKKSLRAQPVEITTLILDLRAPSAPHPLLPVAQLLSLFLPDKTPLFCLAQTTGSELVSTDGIRCWDRPLWILVDEETPGDLELAARILSNRPGTLIFGSPPSGQILDYCELPLDSRHSLLVPSGGLITADGATVSGNLIHPGFPIAANLPLKHHLFSLTIPADFLSALSETDRPHRNEAALMSGSDPELPDRLTGPPPLPPLPDPVLQQVLDLLETSAFLNLDAPKNVTHEAPAQSGN